MSNLHSKYRFTFFGVLIVLLTQSCSYFSKRKVVKEQGQYSAQSKEGYVPQKMYDKLLKEYAQLKSDYQKISEIQPKNDNPSQKKRQSRAFSKKKNKLIRPKGQMGEELLESQVNYYLESKKLLEQGKSVEAMKGFQALELSKSNQISVRAKYRIGEILLQQSEYDLAMQVFEDIVQNYAFSYLSVLSIQKLMICTKKLGLVKKQDLYGSLYNGVFK